jgi:hypothetical protein
MTTEAVNGSPWVPAACTLPATAQPLRLAEFDDLFRSYVTRVERCAPDRVVLHLSAPDPEAVDERVTDLTRREASCCSFFKFTLSHGIQAMQLEVAVPMAHSAQLDALTQRAAQLARAAS